MGLVTDGKVEAVSTVAPVGAVSEDKKVNASKFVVESATEVLATMSEEERSTIGSKSDTLVFKTLLGTNAQKSQRRVQGSERADCPKTVGALFVSTEDIEIPEIDVTLNNKTGIEPDQVQWKSVKAGEEFQLSIYEVMYLITKPEYGGFASYEGNPRAVQFIAKTKAFLENKAKLPTPTLTLEKGMGSIKASITEIDEKVGGVWKVKDQYAEKFGPLYQPKRGTRTAKPSIPSATASAFAVQKILSEQAKRA